MRLAEAVLRTHITEVVTDAGGDINDLATFNVHVVAVDINAGIGGETSSYLQGYVKTGPRQGPVSTSPAWAGDRRAAAPTAVAAWIFLNKINMSQWLCS